MGGSRYSRHHSRNSLVVRHKFPSISFYLIEVPRVAVAVGVGEAPLQVVVGQRVDVEAVFVVYSFAVSDAFSIEPYAGIYLRGNLIGKEKFENTGGWDDDWDDWDDDWDDTDWSGSTSVKDEINLFSKDDMGDDAWNRFQFGAQLGVRARINNMFVVGLGYSTDLSNITEKTKFNSFDVTLGITF